MGEEKRGEKSEQHGGGCTIKKKHSTNGASIRTYWAGRWAMVLVRYRGVRCGIEHCDYG